MAQNRLWQAHMFMVWELKQEGISPSAVCQATQLFICFAALCMSANDQDSIL